MTAGDPSDGQQITYDYPDLIIGEHDELPGVLLDEASELNPEDAAV